MQVNDVTSNQFISHHHLKIRSMADNADIPLGPQKEIDEEGKEIFGAIKHDILHKIWELHRDDERHHLNEARKLKHLEFYKPLFYRVQQVPYGFNYFGKILLDEHGNCVHARAFRPSEQGGILFHAIHVRPSDEGGAVFGESDPLEYFEY